MDDPVFRIRRLYHAVNASVEAELKKFPAKVHASDRGVLLFQDFSGGMPVEEMANMANTQIGLLAGLEDHLRKWAKKNSRNPDRVRWAFEHSDSLQIIHDLNNREKHGGAPRDGKGRSGKAPELVNVRRRMRMQTQPEKGSTCVVQLARDGSPIASGDGSASVILTGEVIDSHGGTIGDLHEIIGKGVVDCEQLFKDLGISVT